jgi:hypothetical protein
MSFNDNVISTLSAGPRLVAFSVDGTGTASISGPDAGLVTLTDNGTGDYSITFATTLSIIPYVFAPLGVTPDVVYYFQAAPTTTVVRILSHSVEAVPAATDSDFTVMMLIDQAPSAYLLDY